MKRTHLPAMLTIAALLGACSSLPNTTSLLDQTRNEYLAAQSNPKVVSYAPLELRQAGDALDQANAAARHDDSADKIDKLAYLAKQKIALTQEVAKQKSAEAEIANAGRERDQIRLDQRTNEANRARDNAEQSKLAAQQAQFAAAQAQRRAQQAQFAAAEAQRKTLQAQVEASDALRDTRQAQGEANDALRNTQQAQGEANEALRKTQEAQARAAELEAQLADLSAKKTERGLVITLSDVLFGTDQSRLNTEGMRTAEKLAEVLQQNPQRTVLVEGFTDSTGSTSHNLELSLRRATAVRSALQELGVGRERIAVRGYGETYPVAANNTAQHRQLNRRVEIVLSDADGKIIQR